MDNLCFVSCVSHAFASVYCCLVVTCWERADFLAFITEQNRTVSLLISGHIHDIEIQCEQQNVIYKGLGIFFLF